MSETKTRNLHVLLVDDDDSLRRALARSIRLAGFVVEAYSSVEALLDSGRLDTSACLVVDVDLPGVSGPEFKRKLAASGFDIPTIFITALEAEGLDERLAKLAPVAILHKPFDKDRLVAAIGQACEVTP